MQKTRDNRPAPQVSSLPISKVFSCRVGACTTPSQDSRGACRKATRDAARLARVGQRRRLTTPTSTRPPGRRFPSRKVRAMQHGCCPLDAGPPSRSLVALPFVFAVPPFWASMTVWRDLGGCYVVVYSYWVPRRTLSLRGKVSCDGIFKSFFRTARLGCGAL